MEWLVRTENLLPADTAPAERERLRAAERARAMELRAAGVLTKLWRTPGRRGTVGVYECRDATHLHDTLASLPMFPWMEVTVEPLAVHPQDLGAGDREVTESVDNTPVHRNGHATDPVGPAARSATTKGPDEQPV
ncbi:muconolactone Delta-isomerase [Streptomyces sp. SBT349]|uniref:muconolactone Delta-isomerase n=1 Tax=Streptomyces sp. SBT349 TaxID=1580539 RepID=UPI0007C6346A|nr:muconolactone Delta-isomerase family protein [Streptomyces sp. SBT349]